MADVLSRPGKWRRGTIAALALLLLCIAHWSAGAAAALEAADGQQKAAPTPADAKETHRRIDQIYDRLGLDYGKQEPERGCGQRGAPQQERSDSPTLAMPPVLGWVLLAIVLAAMIVPLVLALRSGYRTVPVAAGELVADEEQTEGAVVPRAAWEVDLNECRRLAAAGRLPEAFAALHRATLLAFARSGEIRLDSHTTNWEYVRRLTSTPELKRILAQVTEAAERSVLGREPPSAERYAELDRMVADGVAR